MQEIQLSRPMCRRKTSRFSAADSVWACWRSTKNDDVSRVRDLSVGGLFLATERAPAEGVKLRMEFLVQEGQIRVEAEVRHADPPHGIGLKFTAIDDQDRRRLAALINRLRNNYLEAHKQPATGLPKRKPLY